MQAIKRTYPKIDWEVMNDAVHGHIKLHPLINAVIDTPQFQRLRNIKQLGFAYYVYPSACHNRFEHSLGTYHLAGKFLEMLHANDQEASEDEKEERKKEMLCVQIAALCHDLGHGPFSHVWETFLSHFDINWKHEDNSIKVFDLMLEEEIMDKNFTKVARTDEPRPFNRRIKLKELFSSYNLNEDEIALIKDIIIGKKAGSTPADKHYLYQIVSNKDNDIDVDKFDYLWRDSKMVNIPVQLEVERIMMYSKIMNADNIRQICFRDKIFPNIAEMFMSRGVLHDKAYQHQIVKIIDEMVIDALKLAAEKYKYLISTDPKRILTWTDHIFEEILFEEIEDLTEAKRLLTRIVKRELYSSITKIEMKHTESISRKVLNQTVEKICQELVRKYPLVYKNMKKEDLGIIIVEINIGKSNEDIPLGNDYVFEKPRRNNLYAASTAKKYNWDGSTSLMPTLNNSNYHFKKILKRKMIIIYKGEDSEIKDQLYQDKDYITKIKELKVLATNLSE